MKKWDGGVNKLWLLNNITEKEELTVKLNGGKGSM